MEIKNVDGKYSIEDLSSDELEEIVASCFFARLGGAQELVLCWDEVVGHFSAEEFFLDNYANRPIEAEVNGSGELVIVSEVVGL